VATGSIKIKLGVVNSTFRDYKDRFRSIWNVPIMRSI